MKSLAIIILSSLFFINCSTSKQIEAYEKRFKFFATPGTKFLDENIYADVNEISISGYAIYLDWLEHVYSAHSARVKAAMPDSSIISEGVFDSLNIKLDYIALQKQPIVGISYDQAQMYTEWRTNRVCEFWLIEQGKVKVNINATPDDQFTIDKYLQGNYAHSTKHENHIFHFPIYSIPSENDWKTYIYQGIQDSILNEGLVHEIVILENGVDGKDDKFISAEFNQDSKELFTHNKVGKGNINVGFRNICKWKYFGPDSTTIQKPSATN